MQSRTQIPKKNTTVTMTPTTLKQVEDLAIKGLLWKLGASSTEACRRIVSEAIGQLPEKYPNAWQISEYRAEKWRLERLLQKLGN